MKISTTTGPFLRWGDDNAIVKLLKDSGFTAYDYGMCQGNSGWELLIADDYLERASALRAYADGLGLPCNQTHAPFPTARKGNEDYNKDIFPKLVRAIEISGVLGAKVCVVHPCNDYTPEENAEIYLRLAPYARKANVKIGVENMWNWWHWDKPDGHVMPAACSHQDNFLAHMKLLPEDAFVACVDIGHAEMMHAFGTTASKIIETLGGYMQSMHLHDVDLVNDNHAYPFNCKIDYEPIIASLKKIGYKGDITMEASSPVKRVPVALIPAATRYLAEIGKYFKEEIEKD